jgi:hypothetical protein
VKSIDNKKKRNAIAAAVQFSSPKNVQSAKQYIFKVA